MTIQENGSSTLCDVILVSFTCETSTNRERAFFFYGMLDSCIVCIGNHMISSAIWNK